VQPTPTITAVIPGYNAEAFIADAIQSVLAQTVEIAEIVVVDDGSSDQTAEVAASFPRTRVIRQSNTGQAGARNAGIAIATGEWVAFLDADDVWQPRKTEIQCRYITPEAGVIHANSFDPIDFGNLWHRQTYVSPSGALVRKQTLEEVGGFEPTRAVVDDLTLWLKIALTRWSFVKSEVGLFNWRSTGDNYSGNHSRMVQEELATVALIGDRVRCAPGELGRLKQSIRIEYAKHLISAKQWPEATELLRDCGPGVARGWLSLAGALGQRRLARKDVLTVLQSMDRMFDGARCTGDCDLPAEHKRGCMDACHKPYSPSQVAAEVATAQPNATTD
jgi:hypothetical protein